MLRSAAAIAVALLAGSAVIRAAAARELRVKGPAGLLYATDGGRSRSTAVVFIPSLGGTTRQWRAQLDAVRRKRRALALDVRGHGRSASPSDRDYSLPAMARDVHAVVRSARLNRFILVGHSMGGGVALAYAAAHPNRVRGVLLVDPIDDPHRRPADAMRPLLDKLDSPRYAEEIEAYWRQILEGASDRVQRIVLADLRRTPRRTMIGSMRAMAQFDASLAIDRFPGPIRSIITRFNNVPTGLHRVSPRVQAVPIEGTSHWVQMDKPEEFNRMLDDFLSVCDKRDVHD